MHIEAVRARGRHRRPRWLLAFDIVLALWALLLTTLATVALVDNWRDGGPGDGVVERHGQLGEVHFLLNNVAVDHEERLITGEVSVYLPHEWIENLRWASSGESVLTCPDDDELNCHASRDAADISIELDVPQSRQPEDSATVRLADVIEMGAVIVTFPIHIAAVGTPLHFPDDEYRVPHLSVRVTLPDDLASSIYALGDVEWTGAMGPSGGHQAFEIQDAAGLGDYTANIVDSEAAFFGELVVARKPRVRHIIYVVAAAPLLLVAIAARQWLSRRRADPNSHVASLELAAALVALLSLREALVPEGLGGLTRLDYVLAGEIVLIISAVALATLMSTPPAHMSEVSPEPRRDGLDQRAYR